MSTPTTAAVVSLRGRFADQAGTALKGNITVNLITLLTTTGDITAADPMTTSVTLSTQGSFEIALTTPDIDNLTGAVYKIDEAFQGMATASYYIAVSYGADAVVDLVNLSPTGYAVPADGSPALSRYDAARTYATQATVTTLTNTLTGRVLVLEGSAVSSADLTDLSDDLRDLITDLQTDKADLSYVNTKLNQAVLVETLQSALSTKADLTLVTSGLNARVTTEVFTNTLAGKLDVSTFNSYVQGVQQVDTAALLSQAAATATTIAIEHARLATARSLARDYLFLGA